MYRSGDHPTTDSKVTLVYADWRPCRQQLAERLCESRLASVREGGDNTESLAHGVRSVLGVLAGGNVPEPRVCGMEAVEEAIAFHLSAFTEESSGE